MIEVQIGDSRRLIHGLANKSIDCVVTSPPYWGLRDYKTKPIIFDGLPDCEHAWGADISCDKSGGTNGGISTTQDESIHIHTKTNFCSICGAWRGQLGLEPTPELFIKHLLDFFDDVKLKLKDEGNCFVNLGDSYFASGGAGGDYNEGGLREGQPKFKQGTNKHQYLKPKSLVMIPERFAWGMIERGWILRNSIIWYKRNHMPESVTDRWTKAHEVIYFFTKQQKNYFNLDAIREPCIAGPKEILRQKRFDNPDNKFSQLTGQKAYSGGLGYSKKPYAVQERTKEFVEYRTNLPELDDLRFFLNKYRVLKDMTMDEVEQMFGNMAAHHWFGGECYPSPDDWIKLKNILGFDGEYDEVMTQKYVKSSEKVNNIIGKNTSTVWDITTQPYSEAHFATFPLELVRQPILAGCPVRGTVLDPFGGSGTVGEFCRHNDRNAILFELNPEYKKLIEERAMLKVPELSEWCSAKEDA